METGNEKQNVNIADILRYAPKMLELFSPIYGEVYFDYVNEEGTDIRVKTKLCGGSVATFNANGTFYDLPNSECLLFPSTHCRTWQHWQNTLFLESIGSVCVDTITGNKFILGEDGTYFGDNTGNSYHFLIDDEDSGNYLLNSRYATPEETKEFFEELEKNSYKWNDKMVVKSTSQPKFKVDDWIVNNETGKVSQIKKIVYDESGYGYDHTNGWFHSVFEKDYHLWTIDDAKDGDVLAAQECYVIFKEIKGLNIKCHCTYHYVFHINTLQNKTAFHPATKEQRDILFAKMKEEGYEWDDDTKKLIKTTIPKFKVGDIVKFDRPSATVKREILSIDFENERYLTRRTDIGGAIKEFIYFCEQDDYVIVGSHNSLSNLSIEVKVSALADEIIALKQRVKALEIQVIKQCSDKNRLDSLESKMIILDSYNINERLDMFEMKLSALEKLAKDSEIKIDALECGGKPFQCSDKAGDCVTLKDMKS